MAGDFNTFWGEHEIYLFMKACRLHSANADSLPSYPSRSPRKELDFVLYGEGVRVTRFAIPSVRFSDHLPLVCDFEIDKRSQSRRVSAPTIASKHWRRAVDDDGVCWLTLDKAGAAANTLSAEVLEELAGELDALPASERCAASCSSPRSAAASFSGPTSRSSRRCDDASRATAMAARGQALMGRIAALDVPTVAAIDGFALGGGLELALACDYRVAVDSYERTLGLPEVQLGIHPGFGGSVRAVQILGAAARARPDVDRSVAVAARSRQARARRPCRRLARHCVPRQETSSLGALPCGARRGIWRC